MNIRTRGFSKKWPAAVLAGAFAALILSGCEPYPANTTRYSGGPYYSSDYQPPPPPPPPPSAGCYHNCGVVQSVQQVYVQGNNSNATLGTVIGAVVGGALGNQVGHGRGRTAATIGGAVAGGFAGHAIGSRSDGQGDAWQIVVQLNDGRYATVTQPEPPNVQPGDYVLVQNDHVYLQQR